MNTLDMKVYKDGNRTLLVFNNCGPETEKAISTIVNSLIGGNVQPEEIKNIIPMNTKPEPMPAISKNTTNVIQSTNIPDINENQLFEQKGFAGYVEVYQYLQKYGAYLPAERANELMSFIKMHAIRMKQQNPQMMEIEELRNILKIGLQTIFNKKLPEILKQSTAITLDSFLTMGKPVLEWAYLYCVN